MTLEAIVPDMPMPDRLPEALRSLRDERWRKFSWNYVFNGANGAAAARAAGYSNHMDRCKVTGHELLQREEIQEAIQALTGKYLFSLAPKAALALDRLLDNPKHPKHDRAIDMVLNRSGHGETSKVDVNVSGQVTVSHTDTALDDLRALKALMVPREKLVEVFGHSGLERYEKMLALADLRVSRETGPVIEHEASGTNVTD
jgi:hypothetical protein